MRNSGIKFRLLLLGILPMLLLVTTLAYYFIHHHLQDLESALKKKGEFTTKQLAISSIYGFFSANKEALNKITIGLMSDPEIISVLIIDSQGKPLVQSKQKKFPAEHKLIYFQQPITVYPLKQSPYESNFSSRLPTKSLPIKTIGTVKVTLSLQNTYTQQKDFLLNSIAITLFGMLLTILLAIRLSKSISQPIINLTKTANDLANDNMQARAIENNVPEINDLCQSFNSMADRLEDTQNTLLSQIDLTVSELNSTLAHLKEKNQSLEQSTQLAINQNKTKSQFLAHISHEIRTPMNGILGFIELLTKSSLSLQQSNQAQLIKSSASSLLSIVNEILDYSSLETGNFKINISSFNLRENIENCVTSIIPTSHNVQVIINIDNNIPNIISTDPLHLQQLITNLLGNACKFTYQGHIILRCHLRKDSFLFFSISDTGSGIEREHLKNLFQPFLQTSAYAVNNELRTGLGLTICKNIIKRLGGTLGVCTQSNIGSTFWFHLPVSLTLPAPPQIQKESILLIDTFKLQKNAFIKQLNHLGFKVDCVKSISEINAISNNKYDIIFYVEDPINPSTIKEQLSYFSNNGKIIALGSHKETPRKNILALPCRSSYLNKLMSTSHSLKTASPPKTKHNSQDNSYSIFIADDNEINRLLLKSQLEIYCTNVTLASDGKNALSILQKNKFDLIFLDLQMPYFSGQDIINIIKKTDSINKDSPVIAITAHAQSHQRKKLIQSGFDECLIKPVLLNQLSEIIELWLTHHQPTKQTTYLTLLLEKTSGNSDLARTVFNKLFKELEQQPQAISLALKGKDYALAEQIVHKLHGSVSFCGFTDIQSLAKNLEVNLSKQDTPLIESDFSLLNDKINIFLSLKNKIDDELSHI